MNRILAGLAPALLATCLLLAAPAAAGPCGSHDVMAGILAERYGEELAGVGVLGNDGAGVVELFVSAEGSWSIVVTMAGRPSCVISVGTAWEAVEPRPAPPGDES